MSGPLSGFRIVEFEGIGPAPYCGMLLADLGADVAFHSLDHYWWFSYRLQTG